IRADFETDSSIDSLPQVYRDDPEAGDFTARFLALFDAVHEDVDSAIAEAPTPFDAATLPDRLLPMLAGAIGVDVDASWSRDQLRRLVQAAPDLYRHRGTVDGLRALVRAVYGIEIAVEEAGGN